MVVFVEASGVGVIRTGAGAGAGVGAGAEVMREAEAAAVGEIRKLFVVGCTYDDPPPPEAAAGFDCLLWLWPGLVVLWWL